MATWSTITLYVYDKYSFNWGLCSVLFKYSDILNFFFKFDLVSAPDFNVFYTIYHQKAHEAEQYLDFPFFYK